MKLLFFADMNSFGSKFRVSIFGESHGEQIGVVIDGVKPGIAIAQDDFLPDITRRSSGAKGTTARKEPDTPHIVSGIYEGHSTGAPMAILFDNCNTRSGDYEQFKNTPRPGHADLTGESKFHFNDPRGGGHFSGRLTLPIVAAGVIAKKMLPGINVTARIVSIGGCCEKSKWDELLNRVKEEGDSIGAVVECSVNNMPQGLGEPFWDSVESLISHAIFSIPGVRGVEFGDGFMAATMKGSQHNDPYGMDGKPIKNGSGGVNGGISNGMPLVFRVAFKPTSSIAKSQMTLNFKTSEMTTLSVTGRHDSCFALRTPPVVEAMTAIVLANLL